MKVGQIVKHVRLKKINIAYVEVPLALGQERIDVLKTEELCEVCEKLQ